MKEKPTRATLATIQDQTRTIAQMIEATRTKQKESLKVLGNYYSDRLGLQSKYGQESWKMLFPFKVLPNVKKFYITGLADYHPVLSQAGINKRLHEPSMKYESYQNGSLNRYVIHQWIRMLKHLERGNHEAYWRIAMHLLHHSTAYTLIIMHKVLGQWHRDYSYSDLTKTLINLLQTHEKGGLRDIRYHITTIRTERADGTVKERQLGVPDIRDRLYLAGYNMLLTT
jgi:hypothetical protein